MNAQMVIEIDGEQAVVDSETYIKTLKARRSYLCSQIELLVRSCFDGNDFFGDAFRVNFKALKKLDSELEHTDSDIVNLLMKKKEDEDL